MNLRKKAGISVLVCALSLQVFAAVPSIVKADEPTLSISSQETITSGAVLKKYIWSAKRNNKDVTVNADVIEVDLTNPYVKLDAITGKSNQVADRESVSDMVKGNGAVAGVNADFFDTKAEGAPIGPQITSGQVMSTPSTLTGLYAFGITKDNVPVVDQFTFKGSVVAKDGTAFDLSGVNKTYYWDEQGNFSHENSIYMYTSTWGQLSRTNNGMTLGSEVLVQNGKIAKIALNSVVGGMVPADGYILRTSGTATDFVQQHLKEGDPIVTNYDILPKEAWNQYDVKSFKMMIGGHTLLVDEGQPSYFTRDINNLSGSSNLSRTAIGYSQDKKTAYLITADYSGDSKGISIPELQKLMIQAGVWKGMVFDGGGSTQMVARPLGEFDAKLVNKTENGNERKVANGVGVFSTAPKGEVKGLILKGQNELFINESASYAIKAYDEYYNPVASDAMSTQWTTSAPIGTFKDNVFTAAQSGQTKLSAQSGKGAASIDVQVIGHDQIASMKVSPGDISLSEGTAYKLPVFITTKSGTTREVPSQMISWDVKGIEGQVGTDGILHVTKINSNQSAQIVATYDGFSSILSIPIGIDKVWYDLDKAAVLTTPSVYPKEVKSSITIEQQNNNKNLQIAYDFTNGTGSKAAYAVFNDNNGVQIEGEPQYIKMKVFGDGSMNWLRAEFVDANGKTQTVDLSLNINWKGWQQVSANLTDSNMKYPITIKRIYVVNPELGQDERALQGKINLDDITFVYKGKQAAQTLNKVKLIVNNKNVSVNDKTQTLEQAPVIISGNTMIPIRFVTEALGGTVKWNDKERKVTITRGDKRLELSIDKPDILVNGARVTAEVAPKIMNNLTVVPLRIISEQLGWKVSWQPVGQVITLE
jgi:exopolysaccharide biosynthesis protein